MSTWKVKNCKFKQRKGRTLYSEKYNFLWTQNKWFFIITLFDTLIILPIPGRQPTVQPSHHDLPKPSIWPETLECGH